MRCYIYLVPLYIEKKQRYRIMTYDIYQIENIGGMNTATKCLTHCKDEQELEEWRKAHEDMKGQYIVHHNWD